MNPLSLCDSQDEATNFAIEWLRERGFHIGRPAEKEMITPTELRERYATHLSSATLYQRLTHPGCPLFECRRGGSGRLTLIVPNDRLIAWISAEKQPGKMLERRAA